MIHSYVQFETPTLAGTAFLQMSYSALIMISVRRKAAYPWLEPTLQTLSKFW
jgi:hypothetical protein